MATASTYPPFRRLEPPTDPWGTRVMQIFRSVALANAVMDTCKCCVGMTVDDSSSALLAGIIEISGRIKATECSVLE